MSPGAPGRRASAARRAAAAGTAEPYVVREADLVRRLELVPRHEVGDGRVLGRPPDQADRLDEHGDHEDPPQRADERDREEQRARGCSRPRPAWCAGRAGRRRSRRAARSRAPAAPAGTARRRSRSSWRRSRRRAWLAIAVSASSPSQSPRLDSPSPIHSLPEGRTRSTDPPAAAPVCAHRPHPRSRQPPLTATPATGRLTTSCAVGLLGRRLLGRLLRRRLLRRRLLRGLLRALRGLLRRPLGAPLGEQLGRPLERDRRLVVALRAASRCTRRR